jgi:hypothetical protein
MPITNFTGMSEPARLCRRKALECQSTALASTDLRARLTYLHLAKLWREMADEAERQTEVVLLCWTDGGLAKVVSGFDYAANFSSFACVA